MGPTLRNQKLVRVDAAKEYTDLHMHIYIYNLYIFRYIYIIYVNKRRIPAPSKGCQLNPKGCQIDSL